MPAGPLRSTLLALATAAAIGMIPGLSLAQCELAKLLPDYANDYQAFGLAVGISNHSLVVGAPWDSEYATYAGGAYVFRRRGASWVQQAKLSAVEARHWSQLGTSVSLSADRVAVGAPQYAPCWGDLDGDGYVGQSDLGILLGDWGCTGGHCPGDVDADGDTDQSDLGVLLAHWGDDCAPGPGGAFVFRREGDEWVREATLVPGDAQLLDELGQSLAISGDWLVVCSPKDDDNGAQSGSAYLYRRNGTEWFLHAKLLAQPGNPYGYFGRACAMAGDYMAIGAPGRSENGSMAGAVHVFRLDDNGTPEDPSDDFWVEQAKLLASDGDAGDHFGTSVAIDGDHFVAGASGDEPKGEYSGSAYVFRRDENGTPNDPSDDFWVEQAKLVPDDGHELAYFGNSVSLDADRIVVGAPNHNHEGIFGGVAYLFERDENGTPGDPDDDLWLEVVELLASDRETGDALGGAVSLRGSHVLVGAYWDDDNGYDAGSAYVFSFGAKDLDGDGICDTFFEPFDEPFYQEPDEVKRLPSP